MFTIRCDAPIDTLDRPNVILILADDLGYKDVGFMGGEFFSTPNLDRLSEDGMVFRHSYSCASNCAPSRASLMTGQYTPRHQVYTVSPSERGKSKDRKIIPIVNTDTLSDQVYTMADVFKLAGYRTGTFGKWHLGIDPLKHGFDINVGGSLNGSPGRQGYYSPYNLNNIQDGPPGEYLTDRLTDEAISFIKTYQSQPFFLYLPYYAVHTPLMAPDSLVLKYKNRPNPTLINPKYAAMIERLDWNIGRLLQSLEDYELSKNSIIIFTSDNGGIRSLSDQSPLRAGKGSYYEGGVRVPTVIKWPGKTKSGSICESPIIHLDFLPTFIDLLGFDQLIAHQDGISLAPIFKNEDISDRPLYWHFPIYLQAYNQKKDDGRDPLFRTRPGSTMQYGKWKLHHYFEDDEFELYDLSVDLGERNNLIEAEIDMFNKLKDKLDEWRSNTRAPIPSLPNPYYQK